MLEVLNVSKRFGSKVVLDNISFVVERGSITSYLGCNGSGKTTTFHIILSLLTADKGDVFYNGFKITNEDIAYMPEKRSLYYDISVYEQLELIGKLNEIDNLDNHINECLRELNLMVFKDTIINKLSKGNQQKVSLACCLIKNSPIIILDEPFTGLDSENVELFTRVILHLRNKGCSVIISSHQYQPINQICDHFLYLENGHIKYDLTSDVIKADNRRIITINNNDYELDDSLIIKEINDDYESRFLVYQQDVNKLFKQLNKYPYERIVCRQLNINDYITFNL